MPDEGGEKIAVSFMLMKLLTLDLQHLEEQHCLSR